MEPKLTTEVLMDIGALPSTREELAAIALAHPKIVGAYRGKLVEAILAESQIESKIAADTISNLTAAGQKVTDAAVERQVSGHPDKSAAREARKMLEAAVAVLDSKEKIILALLAPYPNTQTSPNREPINFDVNQ